MTTKKEDMSAEQQLAKYLDKYLYSKLQPMCKNITRITAKEQQTKGIDVQIEYENGDIVNIDEKAQLHYIDVCRDTFVFEIDFIGQDNELHPGWLYNPDMQTDTYMLLWPKQTKYHERICSIHKTKDKLNEIKQILRQIESEDFESVDCYLIKREKVKQYLENQGWDEARALEKGKEIRKNKKYQRTEVPETNSFYFYFSEPFHYREAPINIVMKKNVLEQLAHKRYVITKEKLYTI